MMNPRSLLTILSDGCFHSGTEIGKALGMTRAAVWKGIQELTALGLRVDSVRGKGYRMDPLVLLDADAIVGRLNAETASRVAALDIYFTLDSTNLALARASAITGNSAYSGQVHACLAEQQTAGKGRRGRSWVSPLGASLYFSLARRFHSGLSGRLECLSLVTGLAVLRALRRMGLSCGMLKWPNDILVEERKLAGILLEMRSAEMGDYHVVTGIGINTGIDDEHMEEVDQPWVSMHTLLNGAVDRNCLAAMLTEELVTCVDMLEEQGFGAFEEEWRQSDCLRDRPVRVIQADGSVVTGVARGLSPQGGLIVATAAGDRVFMGGEVSLRLEDGNGAVPT